MSTIVGTASVSSTVKGAPGSASVISRTIWARSVGTLKSAPAWMEPATRSVKTGWNITQVLYAGPGALQGRGPAPDFQDPLDGCAVESRTRIGPPMMTPRYPPTDLRKDLKAAISL